MNKYVWFVLFFSISQLRKGQIPDTNANIIIIYSLEVGQNFTGFNNITKAKTQRRYTDVNEDWLVNPNFTDQDSVTPLCHLAGRESVVVNFTNYTNDGVVLSFLVAGDTGGVELPPFTSKIGRDGAYGMARFAEAYKPKFVLLLGDNFYPKGVSDVNDSRFNTSFENLFNYSSLDIPWYVLAGGHDHYGNITAQLVYSSTKWQPESYLLMNYIKRHFPSLLYSKTLTVPLAQQTHGNISKNLTLEIFMIDTQVLCPTKKYLKKIYEKNKYINPYNKEFMWNRLKEMLNNSSADIKLVVGHQPVYSVAKHGPTPCLAKRLKPLLYEYNVTLYLSGHDHVLELLQDQNGTTSQVMDYAVIGSGSKLNINRRQNRVTSPLCLEKFFYDQKGGFAILDIMAEGNLRISFMNSNNDLVYQYNITQKL